MRRGFVYVDDRRDDILLAVPLRKETSTVDKELLLLARRQPTEKLSVRTHDKGTHKHGVFAYFRGQVESLNLNVDKLRVRPLPFDNVVIVPRAREVYLRVDRLISFVALVLLFDGCNVRLVILFHVTN